MPWEEELRDEYAGSMADQRVDMIVRANDERGSMLSPSRLRTIKAAAVASVSTGTTILVGLGAWFAWKWLKKRRG